MFKYHETDSLLCVFLKGAMLNQKFILNESLCQYKALCKIFQGKTF